MIQDIAPHEYHNEYRPVLPSPKSYALYYEDGKALLKKRGEQIDFPTFRDMEKIVPDIYERYTYLFSIDGDNFYLTQKLDLDNEELLKICELRTTDCFRGGEPQHMAFAGITGKQLSQWYSRNRFCGACGHRMQQDDKERMLFCPQCHNMVYPNLSPAVIIAITNGDKILLSQYANREYKRFALIAGFAEIGETLEETVRREVREEVGLEVKNIRYYKSQPWSFSESLLAGFFCELDGNDQIRLEEDELAMADWYEREEIPTRPNNITLTNEMIIRFKNGLEWA